MVGVRQCVRDRQRQGKQCVRSTGCGEVEVARKQREARNGQEALRRCSNLGRGTNSAILTAEMEWHKPP